MVLHSDEDINFVWDCGDIPRMDNGGTTWVQININDSLNILEKIS